MVGLPDPVFQLVFEQPGLFFVLGQVSPELMVALLQDLDPRLQLELVPPGPVLQRLQLESLHVQGSDLLGQPVVLLLELGQALLLLVYAQLVLQLSLPVSLSILLLPEPGDHLPGLLHLPSLLPDYLLLVFQLLQQLPVLVLEIQDAFMQACLLSLPFFSRLLLLFQLPL
jgi:hypothetical protein